MKSKLLIIFSCLIFCSLNLKSNNTEQINIDNFNKKISLQTTTITLIKTIINNLDKITEIINLDQDLKLKKSIDLLKKLLNLALDFSNENKKTAENFTDIILNLFDLLELDLKDNKSFKTNSMYLNILLEAKTPKERQKLIQTFLNAKKPIIVKTFIKDIFQTLSAYLNEKLDEILHEIKIKLKEYLEIKTPQSQDMALERKKTDQILSSIFGALANACISTAQIVGAQTQEEKEQGVLNLVGTACNLASQITHIASSGHKPNNNNNKPKKIEDLKDPIILLTIDFILNFYKNCKINKFNIKDKDTLELLQKLDSLKTDANRANWLIQSLVSSEYAKKIIKIFINAIRELLHGSIDDILDFVQDKLIAFFCNTTENNDMFNPSRDKKIFYYNLEGQLVTENIEAEGSLRFFYTNKLGQVLKGLFNKKLPAKTYALYQNSCLSKFSIPSFVKKHNIDMSQFERKEEDYKSFNDFFTRKLKENIRTIDQNEKNFISPADSKLLVIPNISQDVNFFIKNEKFNINKFLQDEKLAETYKDGMMLIFRLAPYDYHRFHFPTNCVPSQSMAINGLLDSVNPIVYQSGYQPLTENERKLVVLKNNNFGDILLISVGAMFVGNIVETYSPDKIYNKGDEMGYFQFGGSTIVILVKKDKIKINQNILKNSLEGYETEVLMGQIINEN